MLNKEEIENKLKKNYKKFFNLFQKKETNCFRLYDRDIPNWPFIIEIFNDHIVIWDRGKRDEDLTERRDIITSFLHNEFHHYKENIIIKERKKLRSEKKFSDQYEKNEHVDDYIIAKESGINFLIRPETYLDVGLFLDHRPLRERLLKNSMNKNILNLFCYTGSLSVAAAIGGATVTSVDISNTYLDWAKSNFDLNKINIDQHNFFRSDILEEIKENSDYKYDTIIIDPPVFSTSKKMTTTLDIQRDHVWLLKSLILRLKNNGEIIFSNNKRDFKIDPKVFDYFNVTDITHKSIPVDFHDKKIHKCFILQLKK